MEITCPKCSVSIDVTEQMSKQLNQELETEKKLLVDKVRKDLEESYSKKFKEIEQDLLDKESLLRSKKEDDELKQLELQEAKHKLENQEKLIEIERKK